jgi:hypothetical protein
MHEHCGKNDPTHSAQAGTLYYMYEQDEEGTIQGTQSMPIVGNFSKLAEKCHLKSLVKFNIHYMNLT